MLAGGAWCGPGYSAHLSLGRSEIKAINTRDGWPFNEGVGDQKQAWGSITAQDPVCPLGVCG